MKREGNKGSDLLRIYLSHNYLFEDIIVNVKSDSWDQVFIRAKICLHKFVFATSNMDKKTAHEHGHIALELMELIF
jgi:hypothetical protein